MAIIPNDSLKGPLAPKLGLGDTRNLNLDNANASKSERNYSKFVPVGILAIAFLILPITIMQLGQQQDTREHAAGIAPTLVLPTSAVQDTLTPTEPPATPSARIKN